MPDDPSPPTVTHRRMVTQDMIDHLGHMNVRYYGECARAGSAAALERAGLDADGLHLLDVYTRHHREQLVGASLAVRSSVVDVDPDRAGLRLHHELVNTDDGSVAATFVHRFRAGDDAGSDATNGAVDPDAVDAALGPATGVPEHGRPRSIAIDTALTPPPLAVVRDRGLARRLERTVTPEECEADGSVRWDAMPMLTWGGEPVDGREMEHLHEGPNGERIGWATMETRITLHRRARLGDRIQAFGAAVDLRDKTTTHVQWAYHLDDDEPLVSFQVVNLAFDIGARRAMSIPDRLRRREERALHPDLGGAG